jgi:hypothetical protein
MRDATRRLIRRLAQLPVVVVDHLLEETAPAPPAVAAPAGAEGPPPATVVVEHAIRVGPFLRQFGGSGPEDDEPDTYH